MHEAEASKYQLKKSGSWLSDQVIQLGCLAFVSYSQEPLHYYSKGDKVSNWEQVVLREGQCEGCMEYAILYYDGDEEKWLCDKCLNEGII